MQERQRGPVPLGDAIQEFLRHAGLSARGKVAAVLSAWDRAYKRPDARAVAFKNRTLHVEVASPAVLQDLKSFTGESFRRQANELLGEERIRRIVVKLKS